MRFWLPLLFSLLALASQGTAQDYPSKPINVIVPYASGSTGEAAFRIIAADLETRLGQRFVVEPRPGAGGNIGAAFVAGSAPDGYTLLLGATNNFAINQHLYSTMTFDPLTAFKPVAILVDLPFMIFASAQLPQSLAEIVAAAKQKPGAIMYASSGLGSPMHLGAVLFSRVAGIEMTHVPYRSNTQSITALLANDVHLYIGTVVNAKDLAETGKLRIIANAGPNRAAFYPNTPSAAEAGFPGFQISNWWALAAPAGTPDGVIARLSQEIRAAIASAPVREKLAQIGFIPIGNSPTEAIEQMRREAVMWRDVIKTANITLQ